MSNLLNINKLNDDPSYRYKMPDIKIRKAGKGNGSYTFIDNISELAEAINTPEIIILSCVSKSIGSNFNIEKKTLNGHYEKDQILCELYKFIDFFVLCPTCSIPEVIPSYEGSKKKGNLYVTCSACGNKNILDSPKKIYSKTIDTIIKYLQTNEYSIKKGNMIVQNEENNLFNPFA